MLAKGSGPRDLVRNAADEESTRDERKVRKMKYSVWHITAEDFVEVAQFAEEDMAYSFRALASVLGDHYEVTKIGESPIW